LAAYVYLEKLMVTKHRYHSDFARRHFDQGVAAGYVKVVLAVLEARAVEVPAEARACIAGCTDFDQIDIWVQRAATADKIDGLFD
jgi:hypothetical protein